ncbi:hypothetical protein JW777_10700 [bacterium]|nr:hypothetical protein [bacterium]
MGHPRRFGRNKHPSSKNRTGSALARLLLLLACLAAPSSADELVTTGNGSKVLLRADHTWEAIAAADSSAARDAAGRATEQPSVASPESAVAPPAGEVPGSKSGVFSGVDRRLILAGASALGFLILVILGLVLFFSVIQPARKRKSLLQALHIIAQGQKSEYPLAETLLTKAITAGLKKADLDEAYFARAYLRALRDDCAGTVDDLSLVERTDTPFLYLDLWAKVKQEKYAEAYERYNASTDQLRDYLQAKKLMSIACFNLGKEHWKKRDIEAAVQYFDRVRELGVHADRVPASVSDHQVTLGIISLFNNQLPQARDFFEAAKERAKTEKRPSTNAEIGLLLCRWRSGERSALDQPLADIVRTLEDGRRKDEMVKEKAPKTVKDSGKDSGQDESKTGPSLDDHDRTLRNILLWHAVSMIHQWLDKDEKSGLTRKERDALHDRVARVWTIDPKMPDPKLILGLIDYYFFQETLRDEALDRLEKSGTLVPEVDLIIKRERKLDELQKDSVNTYFSIVKNYLDNKSVPPEMKEKLVRRLESFPRFKNRLADLYAPDQAAGTEGPTIQSLANRQEFIRKRMGAIISAIKAGASKENERGARAEKELTESMEEISKNTEIIRNTYDQVEKKVNGVLVYTGEVLLPEEETGPDPSPAAREILQPDAAPAAKPRKAKPAPRKEAGKKR